MTNMCNVIPNQQVLQTTYHILQNQNTPNPAVHNIIALTEVVIKQNYFKCNNQCYKQQKCLAVAAPWTAILSEIFIQSLEHN
jgi:hypothetical protein